MIATTVVVPTVGRPSLAALLEALAAQVPPLLGPVLVVDDRPGPAAPLELPDEALRALDVTVLRSGGRGPARARNLGWRHARTPWVSFLDDDVLTPPGWYADLLGDLDDIDRGRAVASYGRVRVPVPTHRRPTDWERSTLGLATATWISADLTCRRSALAAVGGFDERFVRAFREDADLALRLGAPDGRAVDGRRTVVHPVRPADDDWASLRQQAGNSDDQLMRALHGWRWHARVHAAVGRRPRHAATTAAALMATGACLHRRHRLAAGGLALWLLGTAELAWTRIRPGPRDPAEVRRMVLTSLAIPPAAIWHTLRGLVRHHRAHPWRGVPDLVLLDRDGTLVHDVPYNGDPELVVPVDGAHSALARLRAEGIRLGIVTNQSGVGTGRLRAEQVHAVNDRVAELLGPFDDVEVCVHAAHAGCGCRKPAPGLVLRSCRRLGVDPGVTVLIGDIGSDVGAAVAAGASAYLVPTPLTRACEVTAAPRTAATLGEAVDRVLAGDW